MNNENVDNVEIPNKDEIKDDEEKQTKTEQKDENSFTNFTINIPTDSGVVKIVIPDKLSEDDAKLVKFTNL